LTIWESVIKIQGVYKHWNHPVYRVYGESQEYSQGEANTRLSGTGIKSPAKGKRRGDTRKKGEIRTRKKRVFS